MRELVFLFAEADVTHLSRALADWRQYCVAESRHLATMRQAPNVVEMLQTEAGWASDILETIATQVGEQQ